MHVYPHSYYCWVLTSSFPNWIHMRIAHIIRQFVNSIATQLICIIRTRQIANSNNSVYFHRWMYYNCSYVIIASVYCMYIYMCSRFSTAILYTCLYLLALLWQPPLLNNQYTALYMFNLCSFIICFRNKCLRSLIGVYF